MGKIIFLLGGARSGKSAYAEELAASRSSAVCYLATAKITDAEMQKRVKQHQHRRPRSWKTVEIDQENLDRAQFWAQEMSGCQVLLVDCMTNLLYRLLDKYEVDKEPVIANNLESRIEKEVTSFFKKFGHFICGLDADVIMVSNEVGLGLVPPYPLGRLFRDLMGMVNKEMAAIAHEVYFFTAGIRQRVK